MSFLFPPVAAHASGAYVRAGSTPRQQFIEALPVIDAVIRDLGRRYRLSRDEREEFAGNVKVRLMEDDYAVLRRFEGRSSLATFLRTVIARQFLDERVKAWGRWRPSADALRLGPTAVALERLLERQRMSLEEAIENLRSCDETLDERALRALATHLPHRVTRHRLVDATALEHVAATEPSPEQVFADEQAAEGRASTGAALHAATAALPARDRLLLRLRYVQGATVAEIARVLGEEQKPLYRQIERLLSKLRAALEDRGVSADQVRALTAIAID
jgi:RNA polymerase sigma factor (sigma-70 family)